MKEPRSLTLTAEEVAALTPQERAWLEEHRRLEACDGIIDKNFRGCLWACRRCGWAWRWSRDDEAAARSLDLHIAAAHE